MGLVKSNKEMIVSAGDLTLYKSGYSSIPIYAAGTVLFKKSITVKTKGTLRLKIELQISPGKVLKLGMIKNGVETIVLNQVVDVMNSTINYDFKVNVNDTIMFKAYRADDGYTCTISVPLYSVKTLPIEGTDNG